MPGDEPFAGSGWTMGSAHLMIAQIGPSDPRFALWSMYGDGAPTVLAVFLGEQEALQVCQWIEQALAGTARLNHALAEQLGLK